MSDSPHPRNRQYQQAEPPPIAQNDWFERLARFYMQFGRFLRDVFGVLFVAFAFILLLGVWKFTDGVLVTPIGMLLKLWFGGVRLLVIFAPGYFG